MREPARIPWWISAAGAALLAIGFRLGQHVVAAAETDALRAEGSRAPGSGHDNRLAATLSQIRRRSWKDVLFRVYDGIGKHRVVAMAGGVTFYSILALFPAIAALVSLYGLFADPATIAGHLDALAGVLPGGAAEVIGGELTRVSAGIAVLAALASPAATAQRTKRAVSARRRGARCSRWPVNTSGLLPPADEYMIGSENRLSTAMPSTPERRKTAPPRSMRSQSTHSGTVSSCRNRSTSEGGGSSTASIPRSIAVSSIRRPLPAERWANAAATASASGSTAFWKRA
jgi:hypothetical protein